MEKLPPHDEYCEKCIIGSCIINAKECLPEAQLIIRSKEYFYTVQCQHAWEAICSQDIDKVDSVLLSQRGIKSDFICECEDAVPTTANLSAWLELLEEKYVLRRIISTSTNHIAEAYKTIEPIKLLDQAEKDVLAIRPVKTSQSDIKSLSLDAITKIEHLWGSKGSINGLSTGLVDLDKLTDGLHGGEMVVIAAYPSTGKTTLSINIAFHNALRGIESGFFTAEMRPIQLVMKAICSDARVNLYDIRDGKATQEHFERLTDSTKRVSKSNIHIENISGLTIGQLIALARRMKQKHDIKLAVVDYLQLLSCPSADSREQEVSQISKGIKAIAMELDIPVIALSQLNDDGKLRESRAIGQDADGVWKLSPEGEREPKIQPIKLTVEKNREGATGFVNLTFLKDIQRFEQRAKIESGDVP